MYNDPFNRCQIVQPKTWDSIMDAAEADIKSNPRLIFTPKHKDWRDILKWVSSQGVSRLFESLPYEVQNDIYVNDNEVFAELSEDAKKRFNEARQKYYPDGGQINPPNGETSITARNTKQYDFPPVPSRFDEGAKASNNTAEVANYDDYLLSDFLPRPIQMPYDPPKRKNWLTPTHISIDPKIVDQRETTYANLDEEPIFDGGMLPEVSIISDAMPWYEKTARKTARAFRYVDMLLRKQLYKNGTTTSNPNNAFEMERPYEPRYCEPSAADILYQNPDINAWDYRTTLSFQKATGLKQNGIVGAETISEFNRLKNTVYHITPTNSTERFEVYAQKHHPENLEKIEYDWTQMPEYNISDGCSQWVRKKYDKIVGDASEVGFYANAWQLIKKIERAGGDMLFNIYDDCSFENIKTTGGVVRAINSYLDTHEMDYDMLEAGDVVGMMYPNSPYFKEALDAGTTFNTHVGIVVGKDEKNGEPII